MSSDGKTWKELEEENKALKRRVQSEYRRGRAEGSAAALATVKSKSARQKRLDEQASSAPPPKPATLASDEAPRERDVVLPPIHPNAGVEIAYRRKLTKLIDAMARSTVYWVRAAYRANEPEVAQDEAPADALNKAVAELKKRWLKRFDEGAEDLAEYFATAVSERSDSALKAALKKSGFAVEFKMTAAQRDIIKATVNQNVGLIKSIPEQYFAQVDGAVMRSIQVGRDVGGLVEELQHQHGVTRRRAKLIAQSQNSMATSSLNRARQLELGIKQALWRHSAGGKEPRASHVKASRDGVVYDVERGWFDPDAQQRIFPGQLINCRCTSRSIIPGFI